ncbi:hypothetical protein DAI22_04g064001 [Oryza sativa Japonica Group]|nr:hypothetical protein DAI22_04g064001 [Oryza sativa Japonica Group]
MLRAGARPDGYTLPLLNRAAASLPASRGEAELVGAAHAVGVRAEKLFDEMPTRDVVSWTSLVSSHAGVWDVREVSRVLYYMRLDGCQPSAVTLAVVLRVMAASDDAVALFQQSPRRDAISWNIMISEYSSEGNISKVAEMYQRMRREEVCPSCQTLTTVVAAFAKCKCLREGEKLHSFAFRSCLSDAILVESFVDFYAKMRQIRLIRLVISYRELGALRLGKATHGYMIRNNYEAQSEKSALAASCGSINLARRCFDSIHQKDIVAWSSIIEAYTIHGYDEGGRPNGVTFLSLLSACSHSGLVNEVQEFFDCMTRTFGITPELGHHTCMVDVLGRSGNLDDALQVISDMNVKPDGRIWGALLASCRTYSNSKLASYVAQKLMKLEPGNVGYHVVFSNTQASSDQWDEVESIRSSMVEMDLQKLPAWTCVAETGSP